VYVTSADLAFVNDGAPFQPALIHEGVSFQLSMA